MAEPIRLWRGGDQAHDYMRALFQEGRQTINVDFAIRTRDGQIRHWSFSASSPGTLWDGRRFVVGVAMDITEQKKAEEALAAAHRQVQSIIDNTTSVIYAFDLEERFLLANAALAELLNSTPEQMIGKRRHEFMLKEDADWHEANDHQVIETGMALEFEEYSQLKGRSITWLTTKFPHLGLMIFDC